jgi:hypothetical protein
MLSGMLVEPRAQPHSARSLRPGRWLAWLGLPVGAALGAALVGLLAATGVLDRSTARLPTRARVAPATPPPVSLRRVYRSAAGPTLHYPQGWQLLQVPAHRAGPRTRFFEFVEVSDGPAARATASARVVFGAPADFRLVPGLDALLRRAQSSAARGFHWRTTFRERVSVPVDGRPAPARLFHWSTALQAGGEGFAFAARDASARRWVYGWARLGTSQTPAGLAGTRRRTLERIVRSIRW